MGPVLKWFTPNLYDTRLGPIASTKSISTLHLRYLKVLSADYYGSHYATIRFLVAFLFFFFSKNSRSSRDSRIKRSAFLFSFFFFGNVSIRNLNFGHVEKFNQLMSLTEIRRTDYVIIYSISIYIHANSLTNKEPKVIYFVYEFFTSRNEKKKITSRPSSLFIPLLPFSKTSKTIK